MLVGLGIANVAMYSRWHEVEDGVLWARAAEGDHGGRRRCPDRRRRTQGSRRGDVLLAVNGSPVQTPAEVVEYQHRSHEGTRLAYTLLRLGTQQALQISLTPATRGSSIYFVLAAVGLFTLLVGASVRLRRPRDQATLHFFWLCVAFFGVFTFSFNGPFDRLDWIFYWGDAVGVCAAAAAAAAFHDGLPAAAGRRVVERAPASARLLVLLMYAPALVLGGVRVVAVARRVAGQPVRTGVLAHPRDARSQRAGLSVRLCGRGAGGAGARRSAHITSVTGAPAAALDRLGHRARRRAVRVRLRAALGARRRIRRWRCS